jgi:orotate phosphoribosyltransferase
MNEAKIVAEKLLLAGAVKLSPAQPFTWASGWKSPIYCDNRSLLSFPHIRNFIKSELCNLVFNRFETAEIIAGVATAGIPWGALVADQLNLPFIYVRPKPKDHGLGNQIEGRYEKGQKVVVVEDLVSTGKSSLLAVDALKGAELDVQGMVSIFTYDFSVAKVAFESYRLPYFPLTSYPALLQFAIENNIIKPEEEGLLLKWRENPSEWGK